MIESSVAYKTAITADIRRMYLRAVIDISDPDIVWGTVQSNGEAPWSNPLQMFDKHFTEEGRYATLEPNRWLLDGTFGLLPQPIDAEIGYVGALLSGDDGSFSPASWMEARFSNIAVLQAASVFFPDADYDGFPVDFTLEIKQGGTTYYSKSYTGNTADHVAVSGFTVYNPDAIRITVTRWSLPGRRIRIPEMIPGIYEQWDSSIVATLEIAQQGDTSAIALPYGTCTLTMDNLDRRFEPRNKSGIFLSIQERQGITVEIGVELPTGGVEYKPVGVFYQSSNGWTTGNNDITMRWNLVDIIGLLADREYIPPSTLPTTLGGWAASLVAQLGANFAARYTVDPSYASAACSVTSKALVTGKGCKDILLWICQATGTWPRADAETGYLCIEPLWSQGNEYTLDNLQNYPVLKTNRDIGSLIFHLPDGTQTVINGSSPAASTQSINNPFIRTTAQAQTAARQILTAYGGNQLETVGRGDPSSEIGDVATVQLDESQATTARITAQALTFSGGVLTGCASRMIQPAGGALYTEYQLITAGGTWTAPAGKRSLFVVVGGGGQGGANGTDGTLSAERVYERFKYRWKVESAPGIAGADGRGGKIWYGQISINERQTFSVAIGSGGAPGGGLGGDTTFGVYSSANGATYTPSYTYLASGSSYGRSGVAVPLPNSADGGKGGDAGLPGIGYEVENWNSQGRPYYTYEEEQPGGPGGIGAAGGSGFVLVAWER